MFPGSPETCPELSGTEHFKGTGLEVVLGQDETQRSEMCDCDLVSFWEYEKSPSTPTGSWSGVNKSIQFCKGMMETLQSGEHRAMEQFVISELSSVVKTVLLDTAVGPD